MSFETINRLESEVRSYCRGFPVVFEKARGSYLYDEDGKAYLDFFAGASVLNYGHNHPELKKALLEYIADDNITHSLDMASTAKSAFLEAFEANILKPRDLDYRVQFPGPTGTNAVEAALKLARKVKGRDRIISFTNAFHGMTLGSLSITGNSFKRDGAGLALTNIDFMPFAGFLGDGADTIDYIDRMLQDDGSGIDKPAAVIIETVQAEGGVNVASMEWIKRLEQLCRKHDMLFIVDDIQAGCGRTGTFFSFEPAGVKPDIVTLSKSLSGYGLPFALTLMKPELDIWEPGEHNGTFRGHNLAFVTSRKAMELFWSDDSFAKEVREKGEYIANALLTLTKKYPQAKGSLRGRGMMQAIHFEHVELAEKISEVCFRHDLIIETSGPDSSVLKLLPPLTTSKEELKKGLEIIDKSIGIAMNELGIGPDRMASG